MNRKQKKHTKLSKTVIPISPVGMPLRQGEERLDHATFWHILWDHIGQNRSAPKKIGALKICCQFVARSGCIRVHFPAFSPRGTKPLNLREFPALRRFAGNRWRRRSDSNRRITVLQTVALGHLATPPSQCEPRGTAVARPCQ